MLTDAESEAVEWAMRSATQASKDASDAADRGYKTTECRHYAERHAKRAEALRFLLIRLSPAAANRLAALDRLVVLDQELEHTRPENNE